MDHRFRAERRDVVGGAPQHTVQRFHREPHRDPPPLGRVLLVEVHQVGARDLIQHLGIVRPELALLFELRARFLGLALTKQQQSLSERAGFFGQRNHREAVFVLAGEANENSQSADYPYCPDPAAHG